MDRLYSRGGGKSTKEENCNNISEASLCPFICLVLVINCFNGMHRQLKIGYVRFGSGEKGNSFPGVDIIFCRSISTRIFRLWCRDLLRDDACDD